MSLWLILPRDPLIFRDGRPFTAIPGERSKSLEFPHPSTIAGAVRTLAGTDAGGHFDASLISELKQIRVRGPFLVEVNEQYEIEEWFFPAPADALLVRRNGGVSRISLSPLNMPPGAKIDLHGLFLVGPAQNIKEKPLSNPTRYWTWTELLDWLKKAKDDQEFTGKLGIQGLTRETRTHVSIAPQTQSALMGALFQTSSLEFAYLKHGEDEKPQLNQLRYLALALDTEASLTEGLSSLGGERRVVRWKHIQGSTPDCPDTIKEAIIAHAHCRLILATPAYFTDGYLPSRLRNDFGIKVEIQAVAVPRYQTVSGWDYEKKKPKPTRRLVPAGSVFFLKLIGSQKAIKDFIEAVWLKSISDDLQFHRDGFGLALLGTWDGRLRTMEVKS